MWFQYINIVIPLPQVWSKNSGAYLTAKGYNNRCVLAWRSDCMAIAMNKVVPVNRYVGAWIQSEVAANNMAWPYHDMLGPTAVCLKLSCIYHEWPSSFLVIALGWFPAQSFWPFSWGTRWTGCSWPWSLLVGTCRPAVMIWYHVNSYVETTLVASWYLRTRSEADRIHDYGMTFLRVHRLLTSMSQRPGVWQPPTLTLFFHVFPSWQAQSALLVV